MAELKGLVDDYGIIMECHKILPDADHRLQLIEALAELENNDCHKTNHFPKTRLHKVHGVAEPVYRADINKISGWRLHLQYDRNDKRLHLKDVIEGQRHDDVTKVIKAKKGRYSL